MNPSASPGAASGVHVADDVNGVADDMRQSGLAEPSAWITAWAHLFAPGGAILDLACGRGRHARWLARRGHPVLAVDRDEGALADLAGAPDIETLCADLEQGAWPLAQRRFDGIVVTHYLHRPLWPHLLAALAPGGVLLYETFASGNGELGKPSKPDFLLRPGELLDVVQGRLRVVAFQDVFRERPQAAFVQRICAVREPLAASGAEAEARAVRYRVLQL